MGAGCRRFESCHSDQTLEIIEISRVFFFSAACQRACFFYTFGRRQGAQNGKKTYEDEHFDNDARGGVSSISHIENCAGRQRKNAETLSMALPLYWEASGLGNVFRRANERTLGAVCYMEAEKGPFSQFHQQLYAGSSISTS